MRPPWGGRSEEDGASAVERHRQRREGERRERVSEQGRRGGKGGHFHGRPTPRAPPSCLRHRLPREGL